MYENLNKEVKLLREELFFVREEYNKLLKDYLNLQDKQIEIMKSYAKDLNGLLKIAKER